MRRVLAGPDARRLLLGRAVSYLGAWAYFVALAAYIFDRTGSAFWVAALTITRFLPILVLGTWAGLLVARREQVRLLVQSYLVMAVITVALLGAVLLDGSLWLILLLHMVAWVPGIVRSPIVGALMPRITREQDLGAANTLAFLTEYGVVAVAPFIGAGLTATVGPELPIALCVGCLAVAAGVTSRMTVRSRPVDVAKGGEVGALGRLAGGAGALFSQPSAAVFAVLALVVFFVYGFDTVLFVELGVSLGAGAEAYGYLLAGTAFGGLLMSPFLDRVAARMRLTPVVVVSILTLSLPTAALVLVDGLLPAVALQIVRGFSFLTAEVLAVTAIQRALAPSLCGRALGAHEALLVLANIAGAFLAPLLIGRWGLDTVLLVLGLGVPVPVLLLVPWLSRLERRTAQRAAELDPMVRRLGASGLLDATARPVLERLAATSHVETADRGEIVVTEGDPADALYLVESGAMSVTCRAPDGDQRHLRDLGPDTWFGEIGILTRSPRTATVTAVSDSTLVRFEGAEVLDAMAESAPSVALLQGMRVRLASGVSADAAVPELDPRQEG